MSSSIPPTYYFSGINFNPSFYDNVDSGLTLSTANSLYLNKASADTSAVLETFTAGISTASINSSSTASNFALIPVLTGNMGIGTVAPTGTAVKTIQLGESTVTSVHVGGIDCTANAINNAVTPAGGNLSIGSTQVGGILNLGTNASRSGIINI